MKHLSFEKMTKASRVVVTRVEEYPIWWLFGITRKRMVTRVLKDRYTGIHNIISVRRLTEFESTLFELGDIHSYTATYPEGVHC